MRGACAMALIKCPECRRKISDFAKQCPRCGFPLEQHVILTDSPTTKNKITFKSWLNNFWDWLSDAFEWLGCFGQLIIWALVMGLGILLICFFGYVFSISPMWGYILMFGVFGCPFYFFTRKRWVFWLYLAIVVVLFFWLLSTQQFV